ncbi:hypothetical protein ACIRP0_05425 [Streptomyces sp. NPDC101733]|uniref:hypothetical protein n=1 Tax=unclassified Streptomyces TaxID=2593676 RepID=UPI0038306529
MDEQGGAGGVPPHDGHGARHGHAHEQHARRGGRDVPRADDERTAAADTDEASRLDRPGPVKAPATGDRRWTGPKDEGRHG